MASRGQTTGSRWLRSVALFAAVPFLASATDDLAPLSDEFDDAATFSDWLDLGIVEGWVTPSYEEADIDTTTPGRFRIVPGAPTWFNHLRGLLFFKEVSGDFVATLRVRVLSRHNPADPTEPPNRSFSLTGIFVHGPRAVTQAAPDPYTTDPVWPPGDFGSDYLPNTENYIFLSYGSAGSPGTRQFEIKATRNSSSRLYYASTGIDQGQTEAWLQMVRVGDTVVCLRKHSEEGDWIVENRYPNPDHPFPAFGDTLQLGITAYTDWPTAAPFSNGGLQSSYHFNYAPPTNGQPDLVSEVDYFRVRRPDADLTEGVLQAMSVSYDPATDSTANPPVLLTASPAAAPHLGENADLTHDPFRDWQVVWFGDPDHPDAAPGRDPDGDGLDNTGEFALGGDPTDPASAPAPTAEFVEGGAVRLTFTPAPATGLTLEVQVTPDLGAWTTAATLAPGATDWQVDLAGTTVDVDAVTDEVTAETPVTGDQWFTRLRMSRP